MFISAKQCVRKRLKCIKSRKLNDKQKHHSEIYSPDIYSHTPAVYLQPTLLNKCVNVLAQVWFESSSVTAASSKWLLTCDRFTLTSAPVIKVDLLPSGQVLHQWTWEDTKRNPVSTYLWAFSVTALNIRWARWIRHLRATKPTPGT